MIKTMVTIFVIGINKKLCQIRHMRVKLCDDMMVHLMLTSSMIMVLPTYMLMRFDRDLAIIYDEDTSSSGGILVES